MGRKGSGKSPRFSNGGDIWLLNLPTTRVGAQDAKEGDFLWKLPFTR